MQTQLLETLESNISHEQTIIQRTQSYQIIGFLGFTCAISLFKFGRNKKLTTPLAAVLFPSSCYLFGYNTVLRRKTNRKLEKYSEIYENVKNSSEMSKQEGKQILELMKSIRISK